MPFTNPIFVNPIVTK